MGPGGSSFKIKKTEVSTPDLIRKPILHQELRQNGVCNEPERHSLAVGTANIVLTSKNRTGVYIGLKLIPLTVYPWERSMGIDLDAFTGRMLEGLKSWDYSIIERFV